MREHILRASVVRNLNKNFGRACNFFELCTAQELPDLMLDFPAEIGAGVDRSLGQEHFMELSARGVMQIPFAIEEEQLRSRLV